MVNKLVLALVAVTTIVTTGHNAQTLRYPYPPYILPPVRTLTLFSGQQRQQINYQLCNKPGAFL